jgi:predicted Fe-Mo cluster-binding NifX family protein
MKIAISTDGKTVSPHFGRCPSFTVMDMEDGKLKNKEVLNNPGHSPGFIPQFLADKGVSCIIAGGMGNRAAALFEQADIDVVLGVKGEIDEVIRKIIDGTLEGGESICMPGAGRGYGIDKTECEHEE